MSNVLNFAELRAINAPRSKELFPQCQKWTASDWICALVGEVGEMANFIKKVNRGDKTLDAARSDIAKEIADCILYLDLLATNLDIDMGQAVVDKFNEVSDRFDCDTKL